MRGQRPGRLRRALRTVGGNALFAIAALALVAAAGEVWFRLATPFGRAFHPPAIFHPEAGLVRQSDSEMRWTNRLDYWTVSRTNALGFLDRDPPNPERAAAGCHIAAIGDSFVEAKEVPIADKFHVLLEEMAARELPRLDVTTSAFGLSGTGQANQLPYYDEFARPLRPKALVLVFVANDFMDNAPVLQGLWTGWDPDRLPYASARRGPDGTMALRPPAPDWRERAPPKSLFARVMRKATGMSAFAGWLAAKRKALFAPHASPRFIARAELLSRRPDGEGLLEGWKPTTHRALRMTFRRDLLPPFFETSLEFTAFALDRFAERARRDGASLLVLATHTMGGRGSPAFERLAAMAQARNIPVIDQADAIRRRGAELEDANWAHDEHWNVDGHRWAAEALLDYLKRRPDLCDGAAASSAPPPP